MSAPLHCSSCKAESTPDNEKYWREVIVTVRAVPPRVAQAKKIRDVLCPLCAGEADTAMSGQEKPDDHAQ